MAANTHNCASSGPLAQMPRAQVTLTMKVAVRRAPKATHRCQRTSPAHWMHTTKKRGGKFTTPRFNETHWHQ